MSLINSRFQFLPTPLTPAKRGAPTSTTGSKTPPQKLPKASDITVSSQRHDATAKAIRRQSPAAPVHICVYKITDQAADLWDMFREEDNLPLFQVQMSHDAQKSLCYQLRERFMEYLQDANQKECAIPATLKELETAAGVRLVIADRVDPDNIGFKQWRTAFYCTDVKNFLCLLDGWFQHQEQQRAAAKQFDVAIHPHMNINLKDVAGTLTGVGLSACVHVRDSL